MVPLQSQLLTVSLEVSLFSVKSLFFFSSPTVDCICIVVFASFDVTFSFTVFFFVDSTVDISKVSRSFSGVVEDEGVFVVVSAFVCRDHAKFIVCNSPS